ncbi:MAG TPA: MarR family winged helix-turn-helix transcriptional regulator [Miltoncostaeaceae bacterium]|nr:MarR family winged helix-turn-helix transcriptional regulator [Miltoncostaeaceae bacterium]
MEQTRTLDDVVDGLHALRGSLARLILARAERRHTAATAGERLSTPQHLALSALAAGPLGTSELAARTGVAVSTATRMIQGLERPGYVCPAEGGGGDRPPPFVRLPHLGRGTPDEGDAALRARLRGLIEPLSPDQRELILEAVSVITRTMESQDAVSPAG